MMRALLEERFKLKIHRETREAPVYALVVAKRLALPVTKIGCFSPGAGHQQETGQTPCGWGSRTADGVQVHGSTMSEFCLALTLMPLQLDHRKIIDKTGVPGQFDFDLKFLAEDAAPSSAADPSADLARLQGALRSVGLVVQAKGTEEVVVVDHAERPTAN